MTIGEPNVLADDDCCNDNLLVAQPATLSQTATIMSLSFYVTHASGRLRMGIYDASGPGGGPGVKKAETAEIVVTNGWNTAGVATPVSLPPGTYWLAYLSSDRILHFRKASSASPSRLYTFPYGPLPATFSTTAATSDSRWSLMGTLLP